MTPIQRGHAASGPLSGRQHIARAIGAPGDVCGWPRRTDAILVLADSAPPMRALRSAVLMSDMVCAGVWCGVDGVCRSLGDR